ncbi:MAG: glycosyltransferase [Candidatus Cloacimonadales bacterium]
MAKLLYIDRPFQGEKGGDKNRSKFIWKALIENFEVDLLLLQDYLAPDYQYQEHVGQHNFYELSTTKPLFNRPEAIMNFSEAATNRFRQILKENNYEIIFIRFAAPALLADIAAEILPNAKIVFDIDMLMSRLTKLSWQNNPTFKNRYFYIQNKKFRHYEKILFNKPYLFLFTNYLEKEMAQEDSVYSISKSLLQVMPNVMQAADYPLPQTKQNYILFFGTLNSAANSDAFDFLTDEIYPLVAAKLQQQQMKIRIVGRHQTEEMAAKAKELELLDLKGEVEDINAEIANSLFTILPIRIASGTRTRILEAANLKTAVISTSIGAEGFEFEPNEIIIADEKKGFAEAILKLVENPQLAEKMGANLQQKSYEKYLDSVVAQNLVEMINNWRARS